LSTLFTVQINRENNLSALVAKVINHPPLRRGPPPPPLSRRNPPRTPRHRTLSPPIRAPTRPPPHLRRLYLHPPPRCSCFTRRRCLRWRAPRRQTPPPSSRIFARRGGWAITATPPKRLADSPPPPLSEHIGSISKRLKFKGRGGDILPQLPLLRESRGGDSERAGPAQKGFGGGGGSSRSEPRRYSNVALETRGGGGVMSLKLAQRLQRQSLNLQISL
jgi:hypothetical protein